MSLLDAVINTGPPPPEGASQSDKKRYSEILSQNLAIECAGCLRSIGFPNVKPLRDGPGEIKFQGGVQPKKVDVSFSDERNGLMLAVSIKSITTPPFGKNLKNRFGDLFSECVNLHMRFPYSVICSIFAFPRAADEDVTKVRTVSTFRRAVKLLGSISGREEYTGPTEKFENVTLMLFQAPDAEGNEAWVQLYNADTEQLMTEEEYFSMLLDIYNDRNPNSPIGMGADLNGE